MKDNLMLLVFFLIILASPLAKSMTSQLYILTLYDCAVVPVNGCHPENLVVIGVVPRHPMSASPNEFFQSEGECKAVGETLAPGMNRCDPFIIQSSWQPSWLLIEKVRGVIKSTRSFESFDGCRKKKWAQESKNNGATYSCIKDAPPEKPNQRRITVEEVRV